MKKVFLCAVVLVFALAGTASAITFEWQHTDGAVGFVVGEVTIDDDAWNDTAIKWFGAGFTGRFKDHNHVTDIK